LGSDINIGQLINQNGLDKVIRHVKDDVDKGVKIVMGGKSCGEKYSLYYEPNIMRDIYESMVMINEEKNRPNVPVQKIEPDEEAIAQSNGTEFVLAAYVFTENIAKGMKLIENLDFGVVGWNDGSPSAAQVPFGGMKESGLGREGGAEGIEAFVESQYVSIGLK